VFRGVVSMLGMLTFAGCGSMPVEARTKSKPETPPPGWDRVTRLWAGYSTFSGRVGHVAVSALALTPEVPRSHTIALATRVRDAMPDLPFLCRPIRSSKHSPGPLANPWPMVPPDPTPAFSSRPRKLKPSSGSWSSRPIGRPTTRRLPPRTAPAVPTTPWATRSSWFARTGIPER
jgi:hypothetical protein